MRKLSFVLALVPAAEAAGQAGATTGVIRGEVADPVGDVVPGATILIRHRETDLSTTVETGRSGAFARSLLPPGNYDRPSLRRIRTTGPSGSRERSCGSARCSTCTSRCGL